MAPPPVVTLHASGFSLVETLVSIGVIATLAVLLLSATTKMTEKGNATTCITNFRTMGQTIMLYVADNDGRLPGPLAAGQTTFYSIRPNGTIRQEGGLLALLQPYLGGPDIVPTGKDQSAHPLLCPSWVRQRKAEGKSKDGIAFQANTTQAGNNSTGTTPMKLSAVNSPSTVRMAWEIDGLSGFGAPGNQHIISKPAHGTFRNCLFLDGHVESQSVAK